MTEPKDLFWEPFLESWAFHEDGFYCDRTSLSEPKPVDTVDGPGAIVDDIQQSVLSMSDFPAVFSACDHPLPFYHRSRLAQPLVASHGLSLWFFPHNVLSTTTPHLACPDVMQIVNKELEQCQCVYSSKDRLSIWFLLTFLQTPAGIVRQAISTSTECDHDAVAKYQVQTTLSKLYSCDHWIDNRDSLFSSFFRSSRKPKNTTIQPFFNLQLLWSRKHQLGGKRHLRWYRNGKYSAIIFSLPHFFCPFLSPRPVMCNSSC